MSIESPQSICPKEVEATGVCGDHAPLFFHVIMVTLHGEFRFHEMFVVHREDTPRVDSPPPKQYGVCTTKESYRYCYSNQTPAPKPHTLHQHHNDTAAASPYEQRAWGDRGAPSPYNHAPRTASSPAYPHAPSPAGASYPKTGRDLPVFHHTASASSAAAPGSGARDKAVHP